MYLIYLNTLCWTFRRVLYNFIIVSHVAMNMIEYKSLGESVYFKNNYSCWIVFQKYCTCFTSAKISVSLDLCQYCVLSLKKLQSFFSLRARSEITTSFCISFDELSPKKTLSLGILHRESLDWLPFWITKMFFYPRRPKICRMGLSAS